ARGPHREFGGDGHIPARPVARAARRQPFVGDVRGAGLMVAVEFVADKKTRRFFDARTQPHRIISRKVLDEGVSVRALPFGEITSFSPPLCITRSEIDEVVTRFTRGLERAMPELRQLAA